MNLLFTLLFRKDSKYQNQSENEKYYQYFVIKMNMIPVSYFPNIFLKYKEINNKVDSNYSW